MYDGQHSYRYMSMLNQVYRPWPKDSNKDAYWMDDTDERGFFFLLQPAKVGYNMVGRSRIDGREVIELVVSGGNIIPNGLDGTRVFLDAATYLPYRIVTYPGGTSASTSQRMGLERTFTGLEINVPLNDSDFSIDLPSDVVTVYERAYMDPPIVSYTSIEEAATQVDFPLYLPEGVTPQKVRAEYMVDKDGKLSPVIAMQGSPIIQGRYLPQDPGSWNAQQSGRQKTSTITIDGQQATLTNGPYASLTLTKDGTTIRIPVTGTETETVELAKTLRKVGR